MVLMLFVNDWVAGIVEQCYVLPESLGMRVETAGIYCVPMFIVVASQDVISFEDRLKKPIEGPRTLGVQVEFVEFMGKLKTFHC